MFNIEGMRRGIYFLRRYKRKSAYTYYKLHINHLLLVIVMDNVCHFCDKTTIRILPAFRDHDASIIHPQLLVNWLVYVPLT